MRDPIHWIETQKARPVPASPFQQPRFCPARCRFHQRPPAENDENSDGMETDSRNFQPHHLKNRGRAGGKATPVSGSKLGVLETGIEKMKIDDPGNGERFCDIEPEQPLHRSRINRVPLPWSSGCALNGRASRKIPVWESGHSISLRNGKINCPGRSSRFATIDVVAVNR